MPFFRPALALAAVLCSLGWASGAHSQAVYRIVGPDGKVSYSDRAPTQDAASTAAAREGNTPQTSSGATAALPYALRQIATRFPVTLYTGNDCLPCTSARNLLINRGVPFAERTVTSNEDIAALERLSGGSSLPFGTIGGQQLTGFSDTEWSQYLDAAGYAKQSQWPPGYQRPAATPLVAVQQAAPAPAAQKNAAPPAPVRPQAPAASSGPTPSNPAGIRF